LSRTFRPEAGCPPPTKMLGLCCPAGEPLLKAALPWMVKLLSEAVEEP